MGLALARAWGGHAVGMAPTERLEVEEADGSSSRAERIGVFISLHGDSQF